MAASKNGTGKKRKQAKTKLAASPQALKKLRLVAVAYSKVEREWFPTQEAYDAELEVEDRARQVIEAIEKLGIPAKGYPGDEYFLSTLQIDKPDLVLNLVDTLRGKDVLQTSVPAALELANIPYTGADMQGMVIGNNRNLVKQLLTAYGIPTPPFQFITRAGTTINQELGLPLIVKLNEGGGSVGIDNNAVKETFEDAQKQVDNLINTYHIPVVVERFVDGAEITVVVFDDGRKKHVFMGEKVFQFQPDGKHNFTSAASYDLPSYTYKQVESELADKISKYALKAYRGLLFNDYAKFDVRVDQNDGTPYFTDANPNTAFGPDKGLPFTEVLALNGISFEQALTSLLSKYAKKIKHATPAH
ncbi:MAG: ATP-grasp domain-containing protein [Chloroflexi bacterium]|nr:ATP-grasp domain-containing protein [Chloroflexota bacterium]